MFVGPVTESAIFGQTIAPDSRSRENNVAMGKPYLDGLDNLDQIHAVTLGKEAPLIQIGQNGGAVGVLHDLGGLALNGAVHHGQWELFGIQHFMQELFHTLTGFIIASCTYPPEIADAGHIILPRHHPLKAVRQ